MRFIFFYLCLICLAGCNNKEPRVYHDKSFSEISDLAKNADLPFCIVLIDSSQTLSKEYLAQLHQNQITQKTIFCINDIKTPCGEWLLKWLCPRSLPLTCVFTTQGDLIDLIPGTSMEAFAYMGEAVEDKTTTTFHWPNQFKMAKKEALPLLNILLNCQKQLGQGIYIPEDINNIADSLQYPYPYYLKLIGALMEHDTVEARLAAESLLDLKTPYIMELYKNEFITAKTTLNKNYTVENDATN